MKNKSKYSVNIEDEYTKRLSIGGGIGLAIGILFAIGVGVITAKTDNKTAHIIETAVSLVVAPLGSTLAGAAAASIKYLV